MKLQQRENIILIALFMVLLRAPVLLAAPEAAEIKTDIQYGIAEGQPLLLDAGIPASSGLHPAVILVHGGGWSSGDKQDMNLFTDLLSASDLTWFSINYRLAPEYRWPACLEDVQVAVRWIREHAKEYKADPQRIALAGYSAGGHLVCMAAVKASPDEQVQAVVALAAPTDQESDTDRRGGFSKSMQNLFGLPESMNIEARRLLRQNSPVRYMDAGLPPFLLIHGTADKSVPYQQSIVVRSKLSDLNVPCKLITIEGAPHRITEWEKYSTDFIAQMIDWLKETLRNPADPSQRPIPFDQVDNPAKILTVAADGTGMYTNVQAAVDAVPEGNIQSTVIAIRSGIHKERIVVPRTKPHLIFRSENPMTTILTLDLYASMKGEDGKEIGTFRTPSVTLEADDFTACNITFENSAGRVGQAVALAVLGDRVIFRNCRFLGCQDTLLDQSGRHYYEDCFIEGTCDFIFGGGIAFFERCQIHCLDASYITAASTPPDQKYGYVFSNCTITGSPIGNYKTYLGRPWRDYAKVVFLNCRMEDVINPAGWHNWGKPNREKTAFYGEYQCTGPGAESKNRVSWSHQLTQQEAADLTRQNVVSGADGWDPITGRVNNTLTIHPADKSQIDDYKKDIIRYLETDNILVSTAVSKGISDGLYFACSRDGLKWSMLDKPIFESSIGSKKMILHPVLLQDAKEVFHLLWQTGIQGDCGFGSASSTDLIHWSEQNHVNLMMDHKALDLTSPNIFYDAVKGTFLITWASTLPGNYYQCYQEPVDDNPRLWYTTTTDFKNYAPAEIFFEPGYSVKDGIIVRGPKDYALIHQDNRLNFQTLRVAFAQSPADPWTKVTDPLPLSTARHPMVLNMNEKVIVYYTRKDGKYGALVTTDYNNWMDISDELVMPEGYQYCSVLKVHPQVIECLYKLSQNQDIQNGLI